MIDDDVDRLVGSKVDSFGEKMLVTLHENQCLQELSLVTAIFLRARIL